MELKKGTIVKRKLDVREMIVIQSPYKTIDGQEVPDCVECKWYDEKGIMKHGMYKLSEIDY